MDVVLRHDFLEIDLEKGSIFLTQCDGKGSRDSTKVHKFARSSPGRWVRYLGRLNRGERLTVDEIERYGGRPIRAMTEFLNKLNKKFNTHFGLVYLIIPEQLMLELKLTYTVTLTNNIRSEAS